MSSKKAPRRWPLILIAAPAAVAVWSGWVGLGGMCGFGVIHPLPGITLFGLDHFQLNTAITLPVGVESYGAYAMGVWLFPGLPVPVRNFARRSAIGSLLLGMLGQVAYHLLNAAHIKTAPWFIIMLVSALPVITLGFGAGLTHLLTRHNDVEEDEDDQDDQDTPDEPQRPLEALSASGRPSMSTYSTATAEPLSGPQTERLSTPETAISNGHGSHAAPRSRSWSRDRRAKTIVAKNPEISGAELGRRLGVTERHGQRIIRNLTSMDMA
ncbi:MAG: hypothetical protein ACHQ7M_18990 [Chloroflexota bacterium]